jgi:di/tricarboxylate transporter
VIVPDAWTTWFIGCLPQAVLGMVITPILLYKLFPPEVGTAHSGQQLTGHTAFHPSCLNFDVPCVPVLDA